MQAVEFSTQIQQGMIRIPKQYEKLDNSYVRIIILSEPEVLEKKLSTKEQFKLVIQEMQEKNIFNTIENPVELRK